MKKMYVDLMLSLAKRLPDPLTFTAAELYHRGVISLQEKKQIIKAQSKDKRINELIDVMRYKSDEAFEYLLAIYRDSINRRHDIINPMLEAIRDGKTYREGLPERQPVSHKTVNWPAGTCTSEAAGVSSASDEEYVVVDFFSPSPESQREEAKGGASRGFDIADSFELVNKEEDRAQRSHKLADSDVTVFSGSEGYLGGGSFAEAVRCGTLTKTGEAVAVKIMKILPDQGTRPVIDAKEAKIMGYM